MARRAAADYASMDRANRKPIPAAAFEVDRWASRGGSAIGLTKTAALD
jgi:hypothetical protein